jgi:hypothetical protein
LIWLFQSNLHLGENCCWKREDSRANENETILENESCDVFSNQVSMEKEPSKIEVCKHNPISSIKMKK